MIDIYRTRPTRRWAIAAEALLYAVVAVLSLLVMARWFA